MIFAAITGTPCIAFNNSTGKVAGVYSWIQNYCHIQFVSEKEISEEIIVKHYLLRIANMRSIEIQERMREMTKFIKDVAMVGDGNKDNYEY